MDGFSNYDLDRLSGALRPDRDGLLHYLGAQVLCDRYFLRDLGQRIWKRRSTSGCGSRWVSRSPRKRTGFPQMAATAREDIAIGFYETMSLLLYVPSTPTLFHAGPLIRR